MPLKTVELLPKDFNNAASLLAEAFYHNPSHVYIFADSSTRLKSLQWGLKANLKLNLNSSISMSKSFALVEDSQPPGMRDIKAMGFWNYPQSNSPNFIDKVRSGWWMMPFKFNLKTCQRLVEVMSEMDSVKEEILGKERAWYLNNMAVSEELRGSGVGTKLLQHQLQSVINPSGFPAILMTQKEQNVRFYQKLGFEIAKRSSVGKGEDFFINWCLICKPNINQANN